MELWLDLEQTIISIWSSPEIVNREKIRSFIETNQPTKISIFSFAIWNNEDRLHFNREMKSWLEAKFGIRISHVPTCEEIMREVFWKRGTVMDLTDFIALWGKEKAFHDFITSSRGTGEFVLIDDVVEDTSFIRHNKNQIIRTICVDNL